MSDATIDQARDLASAWNRNCGSHIVVDVLLEDGTKERGIAMTQAFHTPDGSAKIWIQLPSNRRLATMIDLDRVSAALPVEPHDFRAASGHTRCGLCGKMYFDHPYALEYPAAGGRPFLHRTCDGSLVKL